MLPLLVGCKQEEKAPVQDEVNLNKGTQVSALILMGNQGKAWFSFDGQAEYSNTATNKVDSTVKLKFDTTQDPPITWFGDNKGVNGLNRVYYTAPPITQYIPQYGEWTLDVKLQRITFTCYRDCSVNNQLNGKWAITLYSDRLGESMRLEKIEELPNNRKLRKTISLGRL